MSDSLDRFVRDAMKAHDGPDIGDRPTVATGAPVKSAKPAASGNAAPGTVPGHVVEDFIARGGMGAVYRAKQMALGREVAVKVMTAEAESPEMAERFRREALVLGRLEHPNVVPIHDLGTDADGQLFYTMKLVKGRTLQHILNDLRHGHADTLREHRLPALLTIFRKACDAIGFAHSQGIIHRDLKPENVMVGEFGEVLVMDWGLAKLLRGNEETRMANDEGRRHGVAHSSFDIPHPTFRAGENMPSPATLVGAVMGTPQYMSPEQACGKIDDLDGRSDIFSLGGILYAILTLRPPVEGKTLEEVLEKVRTGTISPPTAFGATAAKGAKTKKGEVLEAKKITPLPHIAGGRVPAALSAVAMKALRVEKADRFQSVGELSADIEKYQGGFATSAEQAGAMTQLKLLLLRHKAVTASLAALLLISIGFVIKVMASERKATHHAAIATANEQLAKQNEKRAVAQEEETRRALARSQVAVAESAFRGGDRNAMVQALDSVPEDLRGQVWSYLSVKRDASLGALKLTGGRGVEAVAAVPGQPDCFALAYASAEVLIVNVRTGRTLWQVKAPFSGMMALGFTRDGSLLAVTAKGAKEIHLLRASDGSLVRKLPAPTESIRGLVFSPDARLLVCGEQTGIKQLITMVDASDGSVRWQAKQGQAGMDFSPDGARLFVSSNGEQRFFRIYEVASGQMLSSIDANVYAHAMSVDGRFIAIGLQTGEVVIIDVATGNELRRAKLYDGEVQSIAWTAGGHLLTGGSAGSMTTTAKSRRLLRLCEANTFAQSGIFFGLRPNIPRYGWAFQPASGWLLTEDTPPQRWQFVVDAEAARLTSTAEQGWSIAFASDTLLLSRRRFALGLSDVSDPRFPRTLSPVGPPADVICAVHWRAGLLAIATGIRSPPCSIRLHSTDAAMTLKREIAIPERTLGVDFDATGGRLLAIVQERHSLIFDTGSGRELVTIPEKLQRGVFAGAAGHVVAVVSKRDRNNETQDSLVIFDSKTGLQLRSEVQKQRLNALTVSPDRRLVAVAGEELVVRVLDADTLEERHRFRAHDDDIRALAFHPGQPVLASASNDGTLKLWDYESAKLRQTFHGLDGPPVALAFSPNGRLLALESQERVTRLYDLAGIGPPVERARAKPAIKPDADGWLDLLAAANADDIAAGGAGWRLEDGALTSADGRYATVPLSLDKLPENYTVRVTVRAAQPTTEFGIFFPVAERNIGFNFDMWPPKYGSVLTFNGENIHRRDVVWGRKFDDREKHTIDLTVRVTRPNARIEVQFDGRPHYQWSGPLNEVSRSPFWSGARPGVLSVGCNAPHWIVSEVKVKDLD